MATNLWDVLGKSAEGVAKTLVAHQNAQNTLKSEVMLYKVKHAFEQEAKKGEMKDKFGYDLALKNTPSDYEKMMMEKFQNQEQARGGNPGGGYEVGMGAKGFTMNKINLKDMAERVYMKPQEQWTPQDKAIVDRYKSMKTSERAEPKITPNMALGIMSDPFKSQQFKTQYPELYPQVEKIAKEALGQLNTQLGVTPKTETGDIVLPTEIKTTSQARDYLMKNHDMSEEDAISWIRNQ